MLIVGNAHLRELPLCNSIEIGEVLVMNTWHDTGKETEPDSRNRVNLGNAIKTPEGVRYRVKQNDLGQILLDPVKLVPAYEAWFHESGERVAAFNRSVAEAESEQLVTVDLGLDEDE